MPGDWKPVSYDPETRQLSAIPSAFAGRPMAVLSIVWSTGIDPGSVIDAGTELATIQWEDNSRETFSAPDDCSGKIAAVNRNIIFENLEFEPAEWLLILDAD